MSPRAALLSFAAAAVAGIVVLLIAASTERRGDAFSLDVPASAPVASVPPGTTACQGPFNVVTAFAGVQAQISPAGVATLRLSVRDGRGRVIAGGRLRTAPELAGPTTWQLNRTVPAGTGVHVCIRDTGPSPVTLFGSGAFAASGSLRVGSTPTPDAATLAFERARPQTLLALIPAMFSRAGLFKASWVGTWTFWLLSGGVLLAFVLLGTALADALRAVDPAAELPADADRVPVSAAAPAPDASSAPAPSARTGDDPPPQSTAS
jgi:hypothetical protein